MQYQNEEVKGLQAINIDEITDIGQTLPDGKYVARLSAVNGKDPREPGGAGTVEAIWDVLGEGPNASYEGMEIRIWYGLKVTRSGKNEKLYAAGISEIKQAFGAVGYTLPAGFAFPLNSVEAAKVYGAVLAPNRFPRIEIALFGDKYTDAQGNVKEIQRKKILGVPGASTAPVQAVANGNGAAGLGLVGGAATPPPAYAPQPAATGMPPGAPPPQAPPMAAPAPGLLPQQPAYANPSVVGMGGAPPTAMPPQVGAMPPQAPPPPQVAAAPPPGTVPVAPANGGGDILQALRLT